MVAIQLCTAVSKCNVSLGVWLLNMLLQMPLQDIYRKNTLEFGS